jgi:flagellar hook-associated protein 2
MPAVDGIISGLNTSSIINQLVDAARAPIRAMQSQIDDLSVRKSRLQDLNGLLGSLKTALDAVDGETELPAFSATSSQPDALGVTVNGEVLPNSYDVRVYRLAESTLLRSQGFSSPDQQLRRATLKITVDSQTTNVPIQDANGSRTPEGLAAYINENVDGVHAYILNTGSGATPYRLMIEGDDTGAAHQVTTSINNQGGPGTKLSLGTQRDAIDAQMRIEGLYVYSETNTPDDILPGIQFDLKGITDGYAKITIGRDAETMATNVQAVVDAYNDIQEFFSDNIGLDADPAMQGDQTVRTIQRRLQSALGAGYGNSEIAGLNSIGIGTAQDGTLEFDAAAFTSKSGTNFDALVDMLTGSDGLFGAMYSTVDTVIDPASGIIQPRIDSVDSQVDSLGDKILSAEYRLEMYEDTLRSQFTAMESLLAQYQSTSDYLSAQLLQGLGTQGN